MGVFSADKRLARGCNGTFLPPYAIGYPDPLTHLSGLAALSDHAAELRRSFAVSALKVDHLCAQPWSHDGEELAVRWTLSARHVGTYQGLPATDREVFILGCSHWRVLDGRVLTDWTVFDGMGVLAQLLR